jgi:acyl-CoA synthetase (AMP-forming)/AMP-acid ligase II
MTCRPESPDLSALRRISDYPAHHARAFPDREAAVLGTRRLTYRMLAEEVDRCARALLAVGVGRGDRVATLSTPRPEFLIVFLASLRIGAVWVGLNPVHQLGEHRYRIADCAPRLLFGFANLRGRDNRELLRQMMNGASAPAHLVLLDEADTIGMPYAQFAARGDGIDEERLAAAVEAVELDDVAMIVHTSGSTGQSKGAMITHRNLAHCAAVQIDLFPIAPLRVLCNLPVDHTVCSCDVVAYALTAGGTIVFQERFDPEAALTIIAEERISCLLQIPIMLQKILAVPGRDRFDLSGLQAVFFLGSPMPRALIGELMSLGAAVFTGWGLTEATSSVTYTARGDGIEILAESVGRPAPSFELRIVDPDGRPVPAGETGEVLVRGACVMAGYFNRPEETRAIIDAEGWLHSGDLGRFDAGGRLQLAGRIKEMIKSGGYSLYPREIEAVLETHPAVALAAVVAVPDPLYHEAAQAFLLRHAGRPLTESEIAAFCRSRLANYKIPKRFIIRDELPTLANGKLDKVALRKEAARLRDES